MSVNMGDLIRKSVKDRPYVCPICEVHGTGPSCWCYGASDPELWREPNMLSRLDQRTVCTDKALRTDSIPTTDFRLDRPEPYPDEDCEATVGGSTVVLSDDDGNPIVTHGPVGGCYTGNGEGPWWVHPLPLPSGRHYVVAGTYAQFVQWCYLHHRNPRNLTDVMYVASPDLLRGLWIYPVDAVHFFGTWAERSDARRDSMDDPVEDSTPMMITKEDGVVMGWNAKQVEDIAVELLGSLRKSRRPEFMHLEDGVLTVRAKNGTWKYRLHPGCEDREKMTVMATLISADLTPVL